MSVHQVEWTAEGTGAYTEYAGIIYRVKKKGEAYALLVNGEQKHRGSLADCQKVALAMMAKRDTSRTFTSISELTAHQERHRMPEEEIQKILGDIVWEHGADVKANLKLLSRYGLDARDVTDEMWETAKTRATGRLLEQKNVDPTDTGASTMTSQSDAGVVGGSKMAVTFKRREVVQLLQELGQTKAESWSDGKLEQKLRELPSLLKEEDVEVESSRSKRTLAEVLEAVDDDRTIRVVDEEEEGESRVVEERNGEEEARPARKEPRETARKEPREPREPREPSSEAPLAIERHFQAVQTEEPRLIKASAALASEFKNMERFPHDRDLSRPRLAYLREALKSGKFRGAEWVSAVCEEDGKTYRINGKHTSTVLHEHFESGGKPDPNIRILVRRYSCPTLEDCANLFSTFDTKIASRSKSDILKVFAATNKETIDLSPRLLNVVTSGIAFAHLGRSYRKLSTEDQATQLVRNGHFVSWVNSLLDKGNKEYRHMIRMPVVAAMYRTWKKNSEMADEFWEKIRDDSNDDKDAPSRQLYRWLTTYKLGATKVAKESKSNHEVYITCLKYWNLYVDPKQAKDFRYKPDMEVPTILG